MNLDPFDTHSDEEVWKALEHAHLKTFVTGKITFMSQPKKKMHIITIFANPPCHLKRIELAMVLEEDVGLTELKKCLFFSPNIYHSIQRSSNIKNRRLSC